jgi:accessory colonization factor AcfC
LNFVVIFPRSEEEQQRVNKKWSSIFNVEEIAPFYLRSKVFKGNLCGVGDFCEVERDHVIVVY